MMSDVVGVALPWTVRVEFEMPFWRHHLTVAGVDEVGRGPLAGPVVAAVVVLNPSLPIVGIDDSKRLTAYRREELFAEIVAKALDFGIGMVGPRTIERINILQASRLAMVRAVHHLRQAPDVLLTDAMRIGGYWHELPLIHGDARSVSIGAASIVAKVVRDRYMVNLALQYPSYHFEQNKGYPTLEHRTLLREHGPSPAHRSSFLHKILPDPPPKRRRLFASAEIP